MPRLYEMELTLPLGTLILAGTSSALWEVTFPENRRAQPPREAGETAPLLAAKAQLLEYLDGRRTHFDLPLCPRGTEFQQRVWNALHDIPYGKTWSYSQLAVKIGNPRAVRAVARANGQNPLSIVAPCHRVIGKDGDLRGYAGGLKRKALLLELERQHP